MSLALEQPPDLHQCNLGVALEQKTFSGLLGHPPKRLLAPSPIDLGAIREFGGLYQAIGVATLNYIVHLVTLALFKTGRLNKI